MGLFANAATLLRRALGLTRASSGRPKPGARTIGQLPVWQQLGRIGGTMTPEEVAHALSMADLGEVYALVDLANEARRKDNHLQSILGTRELAASTLPWEFAVPEGARRKDRKIAAWLTEAFQQAAGFVDPKADVDTESLVGFRGLVKHLQGAVYHPFAVSETLYERADGKLWPIAWTRLRQRRFRFDQNTGHLCWFDPNGSVPYPGIDLRDSFAPGKLVIHQPDIIGDDPQREGLARVLLWAALFRNWTLRDVVALAELAWKPWRLATYKKDADQKDIDDLYLLLQELTSSGIGLYPEDVTSLKVEWPAGGGSNSQGPGHLALFSLLGAEMSKSVLGQTLTTEQGDRGSQALGRVHDGVRMDIREFDAVCLATTLQRDLVAPLVWMNFGRDAYVPILRFITEETADLKAFGEGLVAMRKAGLKRIPAWWVRDRAGIPEADEDDEVLGEDEVLEEDEIDIPIDPETGLPEEPADPEEPDPGDEGEDEEGEGEGADPEDEGAGEKSHNTGDALAKLASAVADMTRTVDRLVQRMPAPGKPPPSRKALEAPRRSKARPPQALSPPCKATSQASKAPKDAP